MTLPSKPQQIAAVAKFLDSDFTEGKSLEEVAKAIVNGYHEALLKNLKTPAPPLRVGMLIKTPLDAKVRRVAWIGDGRLWLVSDTAGVGWLGQEFDSTWQYCEEYRPKKKIDGKMVEMTDEMIAEEWSNADWKVGDKVSQHQRQHLFEVIATGPLSVLLLGSDGRLTADSNASMEKYYRREVGMKGINW